MRKILFFSLAAVPLAVFSFAWLRPAPSQPAAAAPGSAVTFRVVFGENQERPKDYSGSVTVTQGRVLHVEPWRFGAGDAVEGSSWKLTTKYAVFENQPDFPRPMSTPGAPQNLVPAGVTITVEAPPSATARIRSTQGNYDLRLEDLSYGRTLRFADGDVSAQRTPTPQRLSPASSEEHDYPSLAVTRSGVVWVAWQAYQDRGDHVYARHSTASGWSETFRLTDQKGDVFQTAVAEDLRGRVWVVWSERQGVDWDLYAKTFDGRSWSARRKITSANQPNMFHRLVADRSGALHLVWIGYQQGESRVYWSKLSGDSWAAPVDLSGAGAWAPDAAFDSKGNMYVVWDSYRTGNYDIFFRAVAPEGALGPLEQVTKSPRFQAHPSVAVDRQDRVWVAWDESGANWGKDWHHDDTWRGTVLYADRRPRVAVRESGVWKQPEADLMAAVPRRYNRYVQFPRLAVDAGGRVWLSLQIRTFCGNNRADFWAANGRWEFFLTSYEGDRWTSLVAIPNTSSRPEGPFQITGTSRGVWMAWANDNRLAVTAAAGSGAAARKGGKKGGADAAGAAPARPREAVYEVDVASFETAAASRPPALIALAEAPTNPPPIHPNEPADVSRMRAYRSTIGGVSLRILRGDFHRHTEISGDGSGDGSVEDLFRYYLDAAQMDTGIITDHNAGNDNEYTWWRTEKAHDLFHIRGRLTPLFGYERSVPYPNGHRNVVFPQRGVRTLPISREEQQGVVNSGTVLYPYLKQNRGVCMLHSLATDQGSDYRDNDPEVEPVVELYQGYHANYEYEGAPRGESANYLAPVHGRFQPAGFYWKALAKGYKLGVQSSSDHISTHSSYTMIYTPSTERADIVESMRKRHTYGATDNILLDFQATAGGRTYMMGDAFQSAAAPRFSVNVHGTDRILSVEIIKDAKFVYRTEPGGATAQFTWVDTNPGQGTSWYYVRVMQMDRNLAWSSPIWVSYGK